MKLSLENIHKSYRIGRRPALEILRNVSHIFEPGVFTSIRGISGSGKSTLLHLMGGLDSPDAGTIRWGEEKISSWSKTRLAHWRNQTIGFIFQSYHLLPELNTLENVLLPAALGRKEASSHAIELLEAVGLKDRLEHRPSELSGGEKQRAAIARALINDPALLLADEPTGNLDQLSADSVIELLLTLAAQRHKTLVIVTHNKDLAQKASVCLQLSEGVLHTLGKDV